MRKLRNSKGQFEKGNSGYWLGKKRPDLKNTGASSTMFKKGIKVWNKGIEWELMKGNTNGFKKGNKSWNEGMKLPYKPRLNMRGKAAWNSGLTYKDDERILAKEKSPSWQGGLTKVNWSMRHLSDYKHFRVKVLIRDGYKCIQCKSADNLHVDHIKPFSLYPELRLDADNARVLCRDCHVKTSTWGGRVGTRKAVMVYGRST